MVPLVGVPRRRRPLRIILIIILIILLAAGCSRFRAKRQTSPPVNTPITSTVLAGTTSNSFRTAIKNLINKIRNRNSGSKTTPPSIQSAFQAGLIKSQIKYTNSGGKSITRPIEVWYPTHAQAKAYAEYGRGSAGKVALNASLADGFHPLVVFSHGYRGCADQSVFITEQLARQGFIVAAVTHADASCASESAGTVEGPAFKDTASWTDKKYWDRKEDVSALIDYMLSSNNDSSSPFYKKVNESRITGMGHSLGGYTILGMVGGWSSWTDSRIKAALLLSPFAQPFLDTDGNLSGVKVPVMFQGGTLDIGITPHLPDVYAKVSKPKYFLVLTRASHFAWTNLSCRNTAAPACVQSGNPSVILKYGFGFLDYFVNSTSAQLNVLHATDPSLKSYVYQD